MRTVGYIPEADTEQKETEQGGTPAPPNGSENPTGGAGKKE